MFSKEPTSKYKPGTVLRQEPSAGTRVSPGSEVTVIVATGLPAPPTPIAVPMLKGLPMEEARDVLAKASLGVKWGTVTVGNYPHNGVVLEQDPQPGINVEAKTTVVARVSVMPDTCIPGYIWREAFPGDRVCVIPLIRLNTAMDNRLAASRLEPDPSKRQSGPDTCVQGLVWRAARPADHVCVVPDVRERTAEDNRAARSRVARPPTPSPSR